MPISRSSTPDRSASADHGESLQRLAIAWRAPLFQRAFSILRDEAAAQDAVQAALLAYWQRFAAAGAEHAEPDNPFAYCMGTVVKLALQARREQLQRARLDAAAAASGRIAPPPPADDPADVAIAGEAWALALELPEAERAILVHRFGYGLTLKETADELGVPLGTVKSRERKALRALRKRYGATGSEGAHAVALPGLALLIERLVSLGAAPADYATTILSLTWLGSLTSSAGAMAEAAAGMKGLLVMAATTASKAFASIAVGIVLLLLALLLWILAPWDWGGAPRGAGPAAEGPAAHPGGPHATASEGASGSVTSDSQNEPGAEAAAAPADVSPLEESLPAAPGRVIAGYIVNVEGQPVPGARVALVPDEWADEPRYPLVPPRVPPGSPETRSAADGRFRLPVPETHAEQAAVLAVRPPLPYAPHVPVRVPRVAGDTAEVNVGRVVVAGGSTIAGRILTEFDEPIAGATIRLGAAHNRVRWSDGSSTSPLFTLREDNPMTRSAADGSFRLTGLPPGLCWFTVRAAGRWKLVRDLDLMPGEVRSDLIWSLQPSGSLRGCLKRG